MSRQYSAQDVIGLPRMKAPAALGLGEALLYSATVGEGAQGLLRPAA